MDRMRLDPFFRRDHTPPPAQVLSDRQVIYDELLFRRWLESTVSQDWVWGRGYASPRVVTADRSYTYQDADLERLRRSTYINEAQLREILPQIPLWRLRDLRFRGVGPRFLKRSPKLVVYIGRKHATGSRTSATSLTLSGTTRTGSGNRPTPRHQLLETEPSLTSTAGRFCGPAAALD